MDFFTAVIIVVVIIIMIVTMIVIVIVTAIGIVIVIINDYGRDDTCPQELSKLDTSVMEDTCWRKKKEN